MAKTGRPKIMFPGIGIAMGAISAAIEQAATTPLTGGELLSVREQMSLKRGGYNNSHHSFRKSKKLSTREKIRRHREKVRKRKKARKHR